MLEFKKQTITVVLWVNDWFLENNANVNTVKQHYQEVGILHRALQTTFIKDFPTDSLIKYVSDGQMISFGLWVQGKVTSKGYKLIEKTPIGDVKNHETLVINVTFKASSLYGEALLRTLKEQGWEKQ